MKSTPQDYFQRLALLGAGLAIAAACAKKSDGGGGGGGGPELVQTEVTQQTQTGSTATFVYKSNIPNAKFKCMTIVEGQPPPADWSDCPDGSDSIQLAPGVKTTFKVKAVDPATNVEDLKPFSYELTGPGAAGPQQGPAGSLATVILNKTDAADPYRKATLALNFGIQGGQVAPADLRFECKRENEPEFHLCPSGAAYDFGTLLDGAKISLDVRGVVNSTGAIAAPDHVGFLVTLGGLIVKNADQLQNAKTGTVQLGWDPTQTQGDKVACAIDQQAPTDCTTSYSLNLSQLPAGSHVLNVAATSPDGKLAASTTISFCAVQCSGAPTGNGTPPASPTAPLVQSFQLGAYYQYTVPADMHVTEYSTTKTYNGQLEFYRVSAQSDPGYLGNYHCGATPFDNLITAAAPDGTSFDYCQTTPPTPDLTKGLTGFTVANNHLEVATNVKTVNNENHEYIDFNVFDADVEYMTGRSRFEKLCLNRNGAIFVTPPIVNLINPDFWGNPVQGSLYICQVQFPNQTGPGLPTRDPTIWRNVWWVGAFFLTSQGLALPQPQCLTNTGDYEVLDAGQGKYGYNAPHAPKNYAPNFTGCATYQNPSLLEMTFVSKTPYPGPEFFAHDVMLNMVNLLSQITPLSNP